VQIILNLNTAYIAWGTTHISMLTPHGVNKSNLPDDTEITELPGILSSMGASLDNLQTLVFTVPAYLDTEGNSEIQKKPFLNAFGKFAHRYITRVAGQAGLKLKQMLQTLFPGKIIILQHDNQPRQDILDNQSPILQKQRDSFLQRNFMERDQSYFGACILGGGAETPFLPNSLTGKNNLNIEGGETSITNIPEITEWRFPKSTANNITNFTVEQFISPGEPPSKDNIYGTNTTQIINTIIFGKISNGYKKYLNYMGISDQKLAKLRNKYSGDKPMEMKSIMKLAEFDNELQQLIALQIANTAVGLTFASLPLPNSNTIKQEKIPEDIYKNMENFIIVLDNEPYSIAISRIKIFIKNIPDSVKLYIGKLSKFTFKHDITGLELMNLVANTALENQRKTYQKQITNSPYPQRILFTNLNNLYKAETWKKYYFDPDFGLFPFVN